MPIHLPALSRRRFLQQSLLAGAGLALGLRLEAAPGRVDENTWALFSDIHIAGDSTLVVRDINMTKHFLAATEDLLALPKRPAGLLVTGDCAFRSGEVSDYAHLNTLLTPIRASGLPVHLLMGNHDHRQIFREAAEVTKLKKRPVADKQSAMVSSKHVNWFLLDSLYKTLETAGELGAEQLQWLEKTLDANRGKPAVIVVHHNPGKDKGIAGLKDTEELLKIIRPRKQVKAWLYGHTHNWKSSQDESGIHLVNLPPVAYIFNEGDPAGWVHATTRKDGLQLQLRCLDVKHKNHGEVVNLKWRTA